MSYETHPGGPATPTARPQSTDLALKLIWTTIAVSVVGFVVGLATGGSALEATGTTPELAGAALAVGVVFFVVFAVGLPVLFAVFIGRGENWARIVYTVFTVLAILLSIPALFGGVLAALFEIVGIALGIAILVLLFRSDSNAYFSR